MVSSPHFSYTVAPLINKCLIAVLTLLWTAVHGQPRLAPDDSPRGANTQFYEAFKVGDTIPDDLKLYRDTGELVSANEIFQKAYTVIVSGCLTCGQFRITYKGVEAVYWDYKDRV
jgi:hypothetical protein